jgi:hypothetical protein
MTKMGVYSWKKSSNEICGSARARHGVKVTSLVVTPRGDVISKLDSMHVGLIQVPNQKI